MVWASLVAQTAKRLPTMWETWVRSLGWEDSPGGGNSNPLQYSCLENPMDRGAWGLQRMGSLRVGHGWATSLHLSVSSLASMSAAVPWTLRNSVSQTFCGEVPGFSFFFSFFAYLSLLISNLPQIYTLQNSIKWNARKWSYDWMYQR